MLPVTVGAGLTPDEGSSVAPRPIPTGEIGAPVTLPSGEVAPTAGVGRAIPVTCASAVPDAKKARHAVINQLLTCISIGMRELNGNLSIAARVPLPVCTKIVRWI